MFPVFKFHDEKSNGWSVKKMILKKNKADKQDTWCHYTDKRIQVESIELKISKLLADQKAVKV